MLILNLTRGKSTIRAPLRLPATPGDVGDANAKLDEVCGMKTETRIAETISDVEFLAAFFRDMEMPKGEGFEQMNELARRIDRMNEQERRTFNGALYTENVGTVEEVLRIADSLEDYLFIPVTTEKALGQFLAASGYKDFPESVKPYLDYTAIGKEYQAQCGGAFTPEGYTLRRKGAEALAPQEKRWWDPIFRVLLQTSDRWSRGFPPYALELPARDPQLQDAQDELQVQDLEETELVQAECIYEPLKPNIPLTDPEFALLRDLSVNLSAAMDNYGKNLVLAVYEAKRPRTLEEAGTLASAVEQYELVTDVEEYGWNSLYELCGDEELLDTVDGYMDWYAFGLHMIEEDGLIPTGQGYVRHLQPDEQPDMEQAREMTM